MTEVEQEKLEAAKQGFFLMCKQYSQLGKMLMAHTESMKHTECQTTTFRMTLQGALHQFHEMGEQMKDLGACIDAMGGDPILQPNDN